MNFINCSIYILLFYKLKIQINLNSQTPEMKQMWKDLKINVPGQLYSLLLFCLSVIM